MTSRISGWCTTPATGRFTASVRLLGYVDCLSRVPGDWYARFCGEGVIAISSPYPTLALAYSTQGDYRRAIECLEQTVAFFEGTRRLERFGQVQLPAVQSRANLAMCHAELGTFAEGRAMGDEGLQIAEAASHPASLMFAL